MLKKEDVEGLAAGYGILAATSAGDTARRDNYLAVHEMAVEVLQRRDWKAVFESNPTASGEYAVVALDGHGSAFREFRKYHENSGWEDGATVVYWYELPPEPSI